jgi:hypothetical protein
MFDDEGVNVRERPAYTPSLDKMSRECRSEFAVMASGATGDTNHSEHLCKVLLSCKMGCCQMTKQLDVSISVYILSVHDRY